MFNFSFFNSKKRTIKPVVLVIMDGWGLAPVSKGNAIKLAMTPNFNYYISNFPHSELIASGESVGLPANEVGNTEVGHLTIGAGRVILQDLKRINMSIEKGDFYFNKAFIEAINHARTNSTKLHIMGLIGSGNVHSSLDHLFALVDLCKKEEFENVYFHLFTDGRDSPPNEGIEIVKKIEEQIKIKKIGYIASVSGRYFAMDRDRRWDRTEKVYKALVMNRGQIAENIEDAINSSYSAGKSDEFIEPTLIKTNGQTVKVESGDSVILFNFRIDRPKQLTMAFTLKDFENLKSFDFGYDTEANKEIGSVTMSQTFNREVVPQNIFFVSMTQYHKDLPVSAVAFEPEAVDQSLPQIISEAGLKQAHMAESEKERFVRYYLNGMREESFDNEDDIIVPSPKVATYDKKPEMSLPKLIEQFKQAMNKDQYHFFVLNFANPDMVAHTGNLSATVKAVETVDRYLKILVDQVMNVGGTVFITADHGNAEELLTYPADTFFFTSSAGTVNTDHSNNPVPLIIINKSLEGDSRLLMKGSLADVATTILNYMKLAVPVNMTGQNLISELDPTKAVRETVSKDNF